LAGLQAGLAMPSANHDEDYFTDATAFDITREPSPHATFGTPGAWARLADPRCTRGSADQGSVVGFVLEGELELGAIGDRPALV
jgi:hypothetical protein